jgi:hypothetical protein
VIFRDVLKNDCQELPEDEWRVVSVLTVAAPRRPRLIITQDDSDTNELAFEFAHPGVLDDLREKIRLVYRMAASNGKEYLVLGKFHFIL